MCQCQLSASDHDDHDQRAPVYLLSAHVVITGRTLFYFLSLRLIGDSDAGKAVATAAAAASDPVRAIGPAVTDSDGILVHSTDLGQLHLHFIFRAAIATALSSHGPGHCCDKSESVSSRPEGRRLAAISTARIGSARPPLRVVRAGP